MKKILVLFVLLLIGCSTQDKDAPEYLKGIKNLTVYSEDAEPPSSIKMVREVTFVAPKKFSLDWYDETVSFYSWLAGIEIDGAGRVFIADNKATKVHVFDSDGKYLKSMGGKGTGPGEFQGITDTRIVSNKLYIFDFLMLRTTVYSVDSLKVIETENVRPPRNQEEVDEIRGWIRIPLMLRSDGTYLAGFTEHWSDARVGSPTFNLDKDRPIKYYFMNKKSKIISNEIFEIKKRIEILFAQDGGRQSSNIRPLPFLGRTIITISDDNHIYTAWTDNFLIKVYGPDGNYVRAFYYPFRKKKTIHREELLSLASNDDWNRFVVEHAELPETWPALYSMIADDNNRLWVSTIVAEDGVREWWVLKDTGELIAQFQCPDGRSVKAVKDGYAYVLETVEEAGIQKVVRYRIEMN